jgi:hypothetical protein
MKIDEKLLLKKVSIFQAFAGIEGLTADKRFLFRKIYCFAIDDVRKIQNDSFLWCLNEYSLSMHVIRQKGRDLWKGGEDDNS